MTDTPLLAPAWSYLVNETTGERIPIADRETFLRDLRDQATREAAAASVAVNPAPESAAPQSPPAPLPETDPAAPGDDAKTATGKETRK